jgi:hypothetical protein
MNTALELIEAVEANGGRLSIEGDYLVIDPSEAGASLVEKLRRHKSQIISLLQSRAAAPVVDPLDAWREDFTRWRRSKQGEHLAYGNLISPCLIAFCEWLARRRHTVTCTRPEFEVLVQELGYVTTDGRISGINITINKERRAGLKKTPYKSPYNPTRNGR